MARRSYSRGRTSFASNRGSFNHRSWGMPGRRGYLGRNPDPNAARSGRGRGGAAPLTSEERAFVKNSRWNDNQDAYYDSMNDGYGGGGYGSGYRGGYGMSGYRKRRWWRSYEFKQIKMVTRRAFAAQGAAVGGMFSLDSAGVLDGLEKWYAGIFATMAMTAGIAAIASRKAYKEYQQSKHRAQQRPKYKPAPPPVLAQPGSALLAGQAAPAGQTAGTPAPGPAGAPTPSAGTAPTATQPIPPPAVPAPVPATLGTPAPE